MQYSLVDGGTHLIPSFNISRRCGWYDIVCNLDGTIVVIKYLNSVQGSVQFSALNISAFQNLERLDLGGIGLYGNIPPQIGNLPKLYYLDLSHNYLSGNLPPSLGNLSQLQILNIDDNNIQDPIPSELGFLKNLIQLDLSWNRISGTFPVSLTNLTNLRKLYISYNLLVSLPHEIAQLTQLQILEFSNNFIRGNIPMSIGEMKQLSTIDLSNNLLSGEIPPQLGDWLHLNSLDLSHNNLSGTVPKFVISIAFLDISYNDLKGPIPYGIPAGALIGNHSSSYPFKPCTSHSNREIHPLVIVLPILIFLIFTFFLLVYLKQHNSTFKNEVANTIATKSGDLFCIWNYDGRIAYEDIIRVTEDFDMRYCIGTGAYGSVYKAQLPCGNVVALKKLHGFEAEVPAFIEFQKRSESIVRNKASTYCEALWILLAQEEHVFDI